MRYYKRFTPTGEPFYINENGDVVSESVAKTNLATRADGMPIRESRKGQEHMKPLEQQLCEQEAEIRKLRKQLGVSEGDRQRNTALLTESEAREVSHWQDLGLSQKEAEHAASHNSKRKSGSANMEEAFRMLGLSEKEAAFAASGR